MIITLVIAIVGGTAVVAACLLLVRALHLVTQWRGKRLVTCPETRQPAAVDIDAIHAGLASIVGGPELRLSHCSRWPGRKDCGQECLAEIERAPEDCLVRKMIEHWYADKSCVLCGRLLGNVEWFERKPAMINGERRTRDWRDVRPEQIPELLATNSPLCWNCHIAETFRREFPDLVTDRSGLRPLHR